MRVPDKKTITVEAAKKRKLQQAATRYLFKHWVIIAMNPPMIVKKPLIVTTTEPYLTNSEFFLNLVAVKSSITIY